MQVIPFNVGSVAEAVAKIRAQLGPEAVVVNVRKLEPAGLARLWQKPRLEVLACRGEPQNPAVTAETPNRPPQSQAAFADALAAAEENGSELEAPKISRTIDRLSLDLPKPELPAPDRTWRIESLLGNSGLLPLQAKRVVDLVQSEHGERPLPTLAEELALTRAVLAKIWRKPPPFQKGPARLHVFIGPFGSGKTTCLCKWLTQAVLVDGCASRVWRLDGTTANNAETLSVHCEILGVPVERSWKNKQRLTESGVGFVDLPGVDWQNPSAIRELGEHLKEFPAAHVHLVLNAAYEVPLLLAQARAFSALPIADLALTHLDEEPRWGKLWNFALGTNYIVRFLSAGQNIPGEFTEASPEKLLSHLMPAN